MLKHLLISLTLTTTLLSALACGFGDDDNNGGSQSCSSTHECINGVCECTTKGKSGNSCDDADDCRSKCEVCS